MAIVKTFVHFNSCHRITHTTYVNKKLLNVKYSAIEVKEIK